MNRTGPELNTHIESMLYADSLQELVKRLGKAVLYLPFCEGIVEYRHSKSTTRLQNKWGAVCGMEETEISSAIEEAAPLLTKIPGHEMIQVCGIRIQAKSGTSIEPALFISLDFNERNDTSICIFSSAPSECVKRNSEICARLHKAATRTAESLKYLDIKDHREKINQDNAEQLKNAFSEIGYGNWLWHIKGGKVQIHLNDSSSEKGATTWNNLLSSDSIPCFMEQVKQYINGETPLLLAEVKTQKSSGLPENVLIKGVGIKSVDGKLHTLSGYFQEVNKNKQQESGFGISNEFTQILIDSIPFPVYYETIDQRISGCNMALELLSERTRDEIIGKMASDIFSPERAELFRIVNKKLLKAGGMFSFEAPLCIGTTQQISHMMVTKSVFYDKAGKIAGLITTEIDISDQKDAEQRILESKDHLEDRVREATNEILKTNLQLREEIKLRSEAEEFLRQSEQRFRTITESSPVALCIFEKRHKHKILFMNPQAKNLLGISQEDNSEWNMEDFIKDHTIIEAMSSDEDDLKDSFDFEMQQCSGYSFSASAHTKNADFQNTDCIFAGITDISNLKAVERSLSKTIEEFKKESAARQVAESALRHSEEMYRILAVNLQVGIWRVSEEGKILFVNPKMCEILEATLPEELLGTCPENYLDEKYTELYREEKIRQSHGRRSFFEIEINGKRNGRRNVIASGQAVFSGSGVLLYYIATFTDITESKKSAKEAELRRNQLIQADKMASLGILVSGVAHEINNPTNFIMLNAPIIKEIWQAVQPYVDDIYTKDPDMQLAGLPYMEMREMIPSLFDGITDGAGRIKDIVSGLKDFARQDMPGHESSVDVNEAVYASLSLLANMLKKSTRKLNVEYGEKLSRVKIIRQRLEQVIINLVQNSCQALESPMKGISIKTYQEQNNVVIEVQDEGVGIPEDNLAHIIDPFFTTKRDSGGTGLGLSISAGIVHEYGGSLEFDSKHGVGTKVRIVLPEEKKKPSGAEK